MTIFEWPGGGWIIGVIGKAVLVDDLAFEFLDRNSKDDQEDFKFFRTSKPTKNQSLPDPEPVYQSIITAKPKLASSS